MGRDPSGYDVVIPQTCERHPDTSLVPANVYRERATILYCPRCPKAADAPLGVHGGEVTRIPYDVAARLNAPHNMHLDALFRRKYDLKAQEAKRARREGRPVA